MGGWEAAPVELAAWSSALGAAVSRPAADRLGLPLRIFLPPGTAAGERRPSVFTASRVLHYAQHNRSGMRVQWFVRGRVPVAAIHRHMQPSSLARTLAAPLDRVFVVGCRPYHVTLGGSGPRSADETFHQTVYITRLASSPGDRSRALLKASIFTTLSLTPGFATSSLGCWTSANRPSTWNLQNLLYKAGLSSSSTVFPVHTGLQTPRQATTCE